MTPRQDRLIARLWNAWLGDRPYSNQTLAAFFFEVTKDHDELRQYNAFEIFDCVTNLPVSEHPRQGPLRSERRQLSA